MGDKRIEPAQKDIYMAAMRGIIGKVLKQGDGPRGRSFSVVIYEKENGELSEVRLGGRLGSLREGDFFSAEGEWKQSIYKGKPQYVFNASALRPDLPKTKAGTVAWLKAILPSSETGLDLEAIRRVVKEDGCVEDILNDPSALIAQARDPNASEERIRKLLDARTSSKQATDLMNSAKLDTRAINSVLSAFKGEAYQRIKRNPYEIMTVPAIKFENADKLGQHMGVSKSDSRRIMAAVWEFIGQAENMGSSAVLFSDAVKTVANWFSLEESAVAEVISKKVKEHDRPKVFALQIPGESDIHLMSEECYRAEVAASSCLLDMIENGRGNDPDKVAAVAEEVLEGTSLDVHQRKAVRVGVTHPISIITGGPGTGKSTILEKLIEVSKRVEDCDVVVTAPTGKAAKRAEEVTGETGQTLQMLLGQQYNEENGATEYRHNRQNTLPDNILVVVDEVSMMDNTLLAALFAAMPSNGRIVLQGDPYQLASVGVGRVLADMIEMNVDGKSILPIAELKNVYRQDKDSKISKDADLINQGEMPDVDETLKGGVTFKSCSSRDITDEIISMVRHQFVPKGINPTRDVAVIVPQAPGYGGTWEINTALSKELNPKGEDIPGVDRGRYDDERMPLPRVGDRVMLTENDHDNQVMNGDIGFIKGYRPNPERANSYLMKVEYDDGKVVEMPTSKWRDVMLAYAITCHKSQGSQYPIVILPFSEMHEGMADRSLVYTGWTRAKNMVIGLGSKETFGKFIKSTKSQERFTVLRAMTEHMASRKGVRPRGEACEYRPLPKPVKLEGMQAKLKTPSRPVATQRSRPLLSSLAKPIAKTAEPEANENAGTTPVRRAQPVIAARRPAVSGARLVGRKVVVPAQKTGETAPEVRHAPDAKPEPTHVTQEKATPARPSLKPMLASRPMLKRPRKPHVKKEEAAVPQPTMKL
ncbi:AAA family ATPase [Salipiger sp. PrR003]|uniref:AAA family ATPase n=1 Tax=Salipiger sp. PrR003 TaxID=2706776 RepID=UPI0013D9C398|nr:AAA family ATPase [Salipiger sp. PrR003]NDV52775.1 AAA family ATPase [Salipiger sp. PrR003]